MSKYKLRCTKAKGNRFIVGKIYETDKNGRLTDEFGQVGSASLRETFEEWYKVCNWVDYDFEQVTNVRHEIHITCTDNKTTHAVKKVDGKIVARAKAVCCPTDEFDFAVGANLAYDRLMRPETLEKEQPKQKDKHTYKAGDKVRIINNTISNGYAIGDIVTLHGERQENTYGRKFYWDTDERGFFVREDDIEPYTEPKQKDKPKFKVGDRVRFRSWEDMEKEFGLDFVGCIRCKSGFATGMKHLCGTLATIFEINDARLRLGDFTTTTSKYWDYSTDMVEPYTEPNKEPVMLYCVEGYIPGIWLTKGKAYEVDTTGEVKMDDGFVTTYDSMPLDGKPFTEYFVPLVSRPAKVGEWVYILHTSYSNDWQPGDIVPVIKVSSAGHIYTTKDTELFPDGLCYLASEYLVLDGYKPEPEYLNMRVVCVASLTGFTVGKIYEFKNGVVVDDEGDVRPSNGDQKITSLSDAYLRDWQNKFIEFKGE